MDRNCVLYSETKRAKIHDWVEMPAVSFSLFLSFSLFFFLPFFLSYYLSFFLSFCLSFFLSFSLCHPQWGRRRLRTSWREGKRKKWVMEKIKKSPFNFDSSLFVWLHMNKRQLLFWAWFLETNDLETSLTEFRCVLTKCPLICPWIAFLHYGRKWEKTQTK